MPEIQPSLLVLILFLVFSLMFFSNSYRLWFKTDQYYQDLYASLTREFSFRPFQKFFLNSAGEQTAVDLLAKAL